MNGDTISYLILQELKLIRVEMKEEIRKLCKSIQFFHYDKTNKNFFESNQVFFENLEDSMHFVNNLTNHNKEAIIKGEHIPVLTERLRKCESNFCAEQCEISFESDNLEVGSQLADIKLDAENEKNHIVKEMVDQENILCETAEHEILPSQPVIIDVKSLCESNNYADELNFDVNSSIFQRNKEVGKPSINESYKTNDFTCKKNDSEILLKPIGSLALDQNNITHQITNENMVNFNQRHMICFQSLSNSSDYFRHIEMQSDNKSLLHNHSTNIVSNTDSNLSDVNHLDKRKMIICKFCNKTYSSNYTLKLHMRTHARGDMHKCDICNKNFSKRSALNLHYRTHTGEKPYQCNICNKRFTSKSHLTNHIRIHTGERPYKCSVCNKTFVQKNVLAAHTRIHTGEKPYRCKYCNKNFRQSFALVEHIRIHTGEKPHKCNICDKRFSYNSNLLQHIRIHTGEKPYKCNVCNKRFSHNSNLTKHARIHTR